MSIRPKRAAHGPTRGPILLWHTRPYSGRPLVGRPSSPRHRSIAARRAAGRRDQELSTNPLRTEGETGVLRCYEEGKARDCDRRPTSRVPAFVHLLAWRRQKWHVPRSTFHVAYVRRVAPEVQGMIVMCFPKARCTRVARLENLFVRIFPFINALAQNHCFCWRTCVSATNPRPPRQRRSGIKKVVVGEVQEAHSDCL